MAESTFTHYLSTILRYNRLLKSKFVFSRFSSCSAASEQLPDLTGEQVRLEKSQHEAETFSDCQETILIIDEVIIRSLSFFHQIMS